MKEEPQKLVFSKINYIILIVGIIIIALGFIFMSMETAEYGFGSMGLTVGPLTILLGIGIEFVAIFYKSKDSSQPKDS